MTEQTAATETTPVLTEDLPGPDPDLGLSAGAGTDSGPGSPPDDAEAAPETPGPAAEAEPEPAPEVDLAALWARISGPQPAAPEPPSFAPLWAKFAAAERDNAKGENDDIRHLNQQYEAAWQRVFHPQAAAEAAPVPA